MDSKSYKTVFVNQETAAPQREWLLVDATDQVLGRLASKVAMLIRGKYKASYTPHTRCGDKVIIINADKIKLTGKKWEQKEYKHHTGYPGGQRIEIAKFVAKKPHGAEKIVEKAIRGMLPKTRLGDRMFADDLYVYKGDKYDQEAQQPKLINLNDLK